MPQGINEFCLWHGTGQLAGRARRATGVTPPVAVIGSGYSEGMAWAYDGIVNVIHVVNIFQYGYEGD